MDTSTFALSTGDLFIRSLADKQQFDDPEGEALALGISSATWALFGVVWPAGRVLADAMGGFPVAGKRILEVGCGLGLASLVLQRRGADITACDIHPLAGAFLRHNTDLNGLAPIPFLRAGWADVLPALGMFDLIIGSDLLYERGHPTSLAGFLALHARQTAQVLLADPGRRRCGLFGAEMRAQGYARTDTHLPFAVGEAAPHRGRMMSFERGDPVAVSQIVQSGQR